MRRLIFCIVASATFLLPALAQAYDVLVVQSRRSPAFDEAINGFRTSGRFSQRVLVLTDYAGVDLVRIVREEQPLMVLAVGDKALEAARSVRQVPVIGLMSLAIHDRRQSRANVSGIGMYASPAEYLRIFDRMGKRRVGVVLDPARSGWYLRQARSAAEAAGVELVVREVAAPRETLPALASLAGRVDALWMLPDATAVTRETVEAYLRFSQEQRLPLVTFSASYLGMGAAAAVELDRTTLGGQAGAMARVIIGGASGAGGGVQTPRGVRVIANPGVLKRLGLPEQLLNDLLSLRRAGESAPFEEQ